MADKLRVCFVCTGNRARSPIAEHAFREVAGDGAEVDSAGVLDLGGAGALPEAVSAAAKHGLDLSKHKSKPLFAVDPEAFDLFIGFELDHLAFATVEAGIPHSKVFTFPELLRLLTEARGRASRSSEDAKELLEAAASFRATGFDIADQMADPLGQPAAFFDDTATRITQMCTELAAALFSEDVGN